MEGKQKHSQCREKWHKNSKFNGADHTAELNSKEGNNKDVTFLRIFLDGQLLETELLHLNIKENDSSQKTDFSSHQKFEFCTHIQ